MDQQDEDESRAARPDRRWQFGLVHLLALPVALGLALGFFIAFYPYSLVMLPISLLVLVGAVGSAGGGATASGAAYDYKFSEWLRSKWWTEEGESGPVIYHSASGGSTDLLMHDDYDYEFTLEETYEADGTVDRDTTATNTVSGTLAGSGTAWWTTDGSSSSTGTSWNSSYSQNVTYPGFYEGYYYGSGGVSEHLDYVGDMFGSSGSGGYTFAALALPGGESGDVVRSATFIDDSPELVDAKKGKKDHHNKGHGNGHRHGRKGDWQTVEGEGYGGEYSYVLADGKTEPSATWTLEGLEPGKTYQVLVTWVADPANASSTTWTIADGSGGGILLSISDVDQTELRADATLGGQSWQSLAIVTATSGAMVVRLDGAGSSGHVVADAVAMVEVVQAVESGQNGRDGDVVLAAAAADGGEGWSWLDCIPGVGAVLRWNASFDRRAAERDRLAAIIAQGNFESVAALQQSKANGIGGVVDGIVHSFELQVDVFTTAPAIAGLITEVGTRLGSRVPSTVQVTSWAESGVTPDLNAGRWVQIGGPTYWNYIKTGLWGGKIEAGLTSKFPWIFEWRPSNVPFSNYITSFVEQSRLMWPPGWEFFKGLLGQRVLR